MTNQQFNVSYDCEAARWQVKKLVRKIKPWEFPAEDLIFKSEVEAEAKARSLNKAFDNAIKLEKEMTMTNEDEVTEVVLDAGGATEAVAEAPKAKEAMAAVETVKPMKLAEFIDSYEANATNWQTLWKYQTTKVRTDKSMLNTTKRLQGILRTLDKIQAEKWNRDTAEVYLVDRGTYWINVVEPSTLDTIKIGYAIADNHVTSEVWINDKLVKRGNWIGHIKPWFSNAKAC